MNRLFTQLGKLLGKDKDPDPIIPRPAGGARKIPMPPSRHGEFYTCPVYNYMIRSGARIGVYEVPMEAMNGLGSTVEDIGPGKTILHSSYLLTPSDDEQLSLADAVESKDSVSEFDPYNSGQFDRSRNWSKHPRK